MSAWMAERIVTLRSERPARLFAASSRLIIGLPKLRVVIPATSFSGNLILYHKLNQTVTFCGPKHDGIFPECQASSNEATVSVFPVNDDDQADRPVTEPAGTELTVSRGKGHNSAETMRSG